LKRRLITAFFLLGFISILHAQTPADAEKAARDAAQRLEEALGGSMSVDSAANNRRNQQSIAPAAQFTQGGRQPRWVNDPSSAYNKNLFIAAVGSAQNRSQAEARALASLVAIFGQSVRSEFTAATMYTEALNKGVVSVSNNTSVRDRISTAASMDNLVGAEIGNVWDSRRGTVYAVAFMDKAKTVSIYTDMIVINNRNIEMLVTIPAEEKNTFDAYARFKLAAQIAGINSNYATVVSQAGGSVASLNLKNADSYNLEAANIMRNITVTVLVSNDRANRVQDAFAGVLSSAGFRTRGNNPAYTLDIRLSVNEVTFPGNNFIFCRIECSANLIDNLTGASLLPYNFSFRDGHATYANAEAAAFANAEKIILEDYPALLRGFIASLMPMN